jgi:hypothetical protein
MPDVARRWLAAFPTWQIQTRFPALCRLFELGNVSIDLCPLGLERGNFAIDLVPPALRCEKFIMTTHRDRLCESRRDS